MKEFKKITALLLCLATLLCVFVSCDSEVEVEEPTYNFKFTQEDYTVYVSLEDEEENNVPAFIYYYDTGAKEFALYGADGINAEGKTTLKVYATFGGKDAEKVAEDLYTVKVPAPSEYAYNLVFEQNSKEVKGTDCITIKVVDKATDNEVPAYVYYKVDDGEYVYYTRKGIEVSSDDSTTLIKAYATFGDKDDEKIAEGLYAVKPVEPAEPEEPKDIATFRFLFDLDSGTHAIYVFFEEPVATTEIKGLNDSGDLVGTGLFKANDFICERDAIGSTSSYSGSLELVAEKSGPQRVFRLAKINYSDVSGDDPYYANYIELCDSILQSLLVNSQTYGEPLSMPNIALKIVDQNNKVVASHTVEPVKGIEQIKVKAEYVGGDFPWKVWVEGGDVDAKYAFAENGDVAVAAGTATYVSDPKQNLEVTKEGCRPVRIEASDLVIEYVNAPQIYWTEYYLSADAAGHPVTTGHTAVVAGSNDTIALFNKTAFCDLTDNLVGEANKKPVIKVDKDPTGDDGYFCAKMYLCYDPYEGFDEDNYKNLEIDEWSFVLTATDFTDLGIGLDKDYGAYKWDLTKIKITVETSSGNVVSACEFNIDLTGRPAETN